MRVFVLPMVLALAFLSACTTPSVPIPPPDPEKVFFALDSEEGTATFSHEPESNYANAVVYVFNRSQGEGLITTANANGSVDETMPFVALAGDEVVISFEVDAELGATCLRVAEGQGSSARECDL